MCFLYTFILLYTHKLSESTVKNSHQTEKAGKNLLFTHALPGPLFIWVDGWCQWPGILERPDPFQRAKKAGAQREEKDWTDFVSSFPLPSPNLNKISYLPDALLPAPTPDLGQDSKSGPPSSSTHSISSFPFNLSSVKFSLCLPAVWMSLQPRTAMEYFPAQFSSTQQTS